MRRSLFTAALGSGCLGLCLCAAFPTGIAQAAAAANSAVAGTPDGAAVAGPGGWRADGKGHGVFSPDAPPVQALPQTPEPRESEPQEPEPRERQLSQPPPRTPHDSTLSSNGILYHGGPVMLGTTHVYLIFYGNWNANPAISILPDWAANLGGSPYFNTNTTYIDGSNRRISNSVTLGGTIFDNYSRGSALDDNGVGAVVSTAIGNGSLPLDAHGVYFVLTSSDVAETSGFCTTYCGWHSFETVQSVSIKYSFVGNSAACPFACEGSPGNAPNGNEGADGMASIMAHELNESVTDPEIDAWYDSNGNEVGDLCNFTYGSTYRTGSGALANVRLGARDFLLQENWVNAGGGYCATALAAPSSFYTVPPCRLIDTRNPAGPAGGPALQAGLTRTFALAGSCGIPAGAKALSVNVTVTQPAAAGHLTAYAADEQPGGTSTINFSAGQTATNNALLRLSGDGSGAIAVTTATAGTVQMILDVNGYFQ
jgi:Phosphate-induced protein 1 conserved region